MLPSLQAIDRKELLSDPALRELYFGSTDTPGIIAQATDAAQKALLDQPAILQETAGLSPDEIRAREIARAGIGSFQPFLQTAEQSFGRGLGALQSSIGFGGPSARQLLRGSLLGFDPRMTGQFYNPFEEQVVQQTIDDTMRAAAQQDIAQRASDIARGGQSAFGSRARLTAEERQRGIGRGLGEALSKIRSGGFLTAQDRALQEFQRQRDAARQAASLERGFGSDLSAAQRLFGSDIADLGAVEQRLRGIDIANLTGLGATERGIEEQRLARQFAQQQATRQAPLEATKFVQGFLPQYQASQTAIGKTYTAPRDPYKDALGTALGTYAALAPKQQQTSSLESLLAANLQNQTPTNPQTNTGNFQFVGNQPPQMQPNFGMQQPQQGFYNAAIPFQVPRSPTFGTNMPNPQIAQQPTTIVPQMPSQGIFGLPQAYKGTYA